MKIILYLYYFFRSVFLRGLVNTLRLLRAEMVYEKKFEISTAAIKKSDSKEFFHYQGASYRVLFRVFSELQKQIPGFDFVDIGCGKGRAVFVAEYCGFEQLTGIELDAALIKEAETNLLLYPFKRKESAIRFFHANALEYQYKNEPTVYFLFNPFNEEILRRVLDKICSLSTSETWFVYMNPLYPAPFAQKGIQRHKEFKTRFYKEAIVFRRPAVEDKNHISS